MKTCSERRLLREAKAQHAAAEVQADKRLWFETRQRAAAAGRWLLVAFVSVAQRQRGGAAEDQGDVSGVPDVFSLHKAEMVTLGRVAAGIHM